MNYIVEIWQKEDMYWWYIFDEAKDNKQFRVAGGEPTNFKCESFNCARTLSQAEQQAAQAKKNLEENPDFYVKKPARLIKRDEEVNPEEQINRLAKWIRRGKNSLDFPDNK